MSAVGLNNDIISGLSSQYLILPRDGDTACDKLVVEVIVRGVKVHAFDGGELLDVQDVFTVHGSRLETEKNEDNSEKESLTAEEKRNVKLL